MCVFSNNYFSFQTQKCPCFCFMAEIYSSLFFLPIMAMIRRRKTHIHNEVARLKLHPSVRHRRSDISPVQTTRGFPHENNLLLCAASSYVIMSPVWSWMCGYFYLLSVSSGVRRFPVDQTRYGCCSVTLRPLATKAEAFTQTAWKTGKLSLRRLFLWIFLCLCLPLWVWEKVGQPARPGYCSVEPINHIIMLQMELVLSVVLRPRKCF